MRFLPCRCLLCSLPLWQEEESRLQVCLSCRMRFLSLRGEPGACAVCRQPLLGKLNHCADCAGGPWAFECLHGLFPYGSPGGELVRLYKLGSLPQLSRFLAQFFLGNLESGIPIVPVPALAKNHKKRGWDPVDSVARELGRQNNMPVWSCLGRRDSVSQKTLGREDRKTNAERAYYLSKTFPPVPYLWLIDDVVTTGSTVQACSVLLKEGGAQRVGVLCLCLH